VNSNLFKILELASILYVDGCVFNVNFYDKLKNIKNIYWSECTAISNEIKEKKSLFD